jgi:Protein of unknown function (DUF2793)
MPVTVSGSGRSYALVNNSFTNAASGTVISPADANSAHGDLAAALNTALVLSPIEGQRRQMGIQAYTATPPASPSEGQVWLVAAGGTGVFAGKDKKYGAYVSASWTFFDPAPGDMAIVVGSRQSFIYDASGIWQPGYTLPGAFAAIGANSDITSLAGLTTPLSTAQGGTGANTVAGAIAAIGAPVVPQGRLTLISGAPVVTSTVSGATTIYYTPHIGRLVSIYDGARFVPTDIGGELSNVTTASSVNKAGPAAVGANAIYDLFVWNDAGVIRLTRGPAWSVAGAGTSTRGTGASTTELARVNGILVNAWAITNGPGVNLGTYVGTILSNGSSTIDWIYGSAAVGGGAARFCVWNMYNRVDVATCVADATASWTYATAAWRFANNSSSMSVTFVFGAVGDDVLSVYNAMLSASVAGNPISTGVGLNTSSTFSQTTSFSNVVNSIASSSYYSGSVPAGWNFVAAVEYGNATAAGFFVGNSGAPSRMQSGLTATLRM